MMQRLRLPALLLLSLGATAAHADRMTTKDIVKVAPENGMPAVGPIKPTWCDAVGDDNGSGGWTSLVRHSDTTSNRTSSVWDSRVNGIRSTCHDPDNPAFQAQVGMYVQRWVNETGASPQLLASYFKLVAEKKEEALGKATCEKIPPVEEGSARDKELRRMELHVLGCSNAGDFSLPVHIGLNRRDLFTAWHFDRTEAPPSQVIGLGRVLHCVTPEKPVPSDLARWAVCRMELAQLDAARIDAELKAAGHNELARNYAQQAFATATMLGRVLDKELAAATAKDPDVKTVVDAAAAGWKQWVADYAANKALVDAAIAYEDKFEGIRKSAAKNCLPSLTGTLGQIATRGKGTVEEVLRTAVSGLNPIVISHLQRCMESDVTPKYGRNLTALMLQLALEWGAPTRGPRTAAAVAMSKAAATIAADRTSFPWKPTDVGVSAPWATHKSELGHVDREGEVASMKADGDKIVVTFKTVKFKEQEQFCQDTNKIVMWSADGTPIYARNCKYTGRVVTRDLTAEPFWMWKHVAGGITKGTVVKVIGGGLIAGVPDEGYPVEVWSKDGKKLLGVMGLEVKP